MKKINLTTLVIILFTFVVGCSKNATQSTGDTSRKPTGFVNSAILFEGSITLATDSLAGTSVTAVNGSGSFSTTTDAKGNFTLPVVAKSGMVTITYSHKGFGTKQEYYTESNYDSIQNGLFIPEGTILYRISPVVVNSLTGAVNGTELTLTCNVTAPATGDNAVRFAVSKSSNVAYDNCKTLNNITAGFPVKNGDNTFTICTPCEQQCGYKPGDTLYIKAYGDVGPLISYYNSFEDRVVLPCVNTDSKSQVVSFIVGK